MKSKSEFISDILLNKKLTVQDRERLLLLTAQEFNKDAIEIEKIWEEIEKLKGQNSNISDISGQIKSIDQDISNSLKTKENIDHDENILTNIFKQNLFDQEIKLASNDYINLSSNAQVLEVKENVLDANYENSNIKKANLMIHDPSTISEFLGKFRENTDLKWTTHAWDENKYSRIQDFIDALNQDKKYKKLFNLNRKLFNLISYFIYNPNAALDANGIPKFGWPQLNEMKFGWQYPSNMLINWCKEYFDNDEKRKYPFQYDLPKELQPKGLIKGKIIKTFENVVEVFKTEIQFRDNFFRNELEKRKNRMSDFEFEGLEKFELLDFYTYTSGIMSAIDVILTEIRKNEIAKKISFFNTTTDNQLIIDIIHIDSIPNRQLNTKNLNTFLGGGLNSIAENLFSLCDFSIISRFKNENGENVPGELLINHNGTKGIAYGNSIMLQTSPKFRPVDEEITGFTYRLKFYI